MSSTTQSRVSPGVPTGGQFATTSKSESAVSLVPAIDPEKALAGIGKALDSHYMVEMSEIRRELTRIQREQGAAAALEEARKHNSHQGHCARHQDMDHTASWCAGCKVAYAIEAWTNPAPTPTPYGVLPGPEKSHHLQQIISEHTNDDESSTERIVSELNGDEKLEAAVRKLLDAPAGAPVTVTQDETTDYSRYTHEHTTEIEVRAGESSATFSGMGQLMRALDRSERPSARDMALRFMRATSAERPLLQGVAAVYLTKAYAAPEPVFGQVLQVYGSGDREQVHLLHTDGRSEFIYLSQISGILETDQSSTYEEPTKTENQP